MANETYHTRGQMVHGYLVQEHPLYMVWADMKSRCRNPNENGFENYGGRGITYCDRWAHFANFAEDMWPKPFPEATLERINNSKGYSPDNCTWATRTEQCLNRRTFKNSHTGETGVSPVRGGRFQAKYCHSGVNYNLGRFATPEEASDYRSEFIRIFEQSPANALVMTERRARCDSSVGIRGISAHSKKGFVVRAQKDGVRKYLGFSMTLEGAIALLEGAADDQR